MEIDVTIQERYSLSANGVELGSFDVVSRWEYFLKLRQGADVVYLYDPGASVTDTDFLRLLGLDHGEKQKLQVVMASPSVYDRILNIGKRKGAPA